jgi:phenylpropionate dioxygenase-like ring-hydroxylating dioxygenase large terminal subunit
VTGNLAAKLHQRIDVLRAAKSTDLADSVLRVSADDYTSPAVLQAELQQVFFGGPVFVGLSGAADRTGDWFTVDLAGRGVLIVRGDDGTLRAFRNACPHRGMQLVDGCGSGARRITCPFHAWSFDATGTNRGIPFRQGFDQYARDELDLVPVAVAERGGLVFVSFADRALDDATLDAACGGVGVELAELNISDQVLIDRRTRDCSLNWKLAIDSYMEAYHLHFLHRASLQPFFFNDASPFDAFGPNGRIGGIRRSVIDVLDGTNQTDTVLDHVTLEYHLFPNSVLIFQQDHFELSQAVPHPTDPSRCTVVQSVYGPRDRRDDASIQRFRKSFELLLSVTIAEDFAAAELIQRNLASGGTTHLRLGRNEPALVHFHSTLHARLSVVAPTAHGRAASS